MSTDPNAQHDSDRVLHQGAEEAVIDQHMQDASTQGAITDLTVPASATYSQAEATATRTALNQVLGVLRGAQLIP